MELREAILSLDAGNPDHWTAAGLPSVHGLTAIMGDTVTRQEIAEAAPGYDREKAIAAKNAGEMPSLTDAPFHAPAPENEPPAPDDDEGETVTVRDGETGELVGDEPAGNSVNAEPDAIALIEAALAAAQGPRYRHNYDLQAFIRQWHVQQVPIKEIQKRIDARNLRRAAG